MEVNIHMPNNITESLTSQYSWLNDGYADGMTARRPTNVRV